MYAKTMTYLDRQNDRQAWLAESVPTTDNGGWKVSADGRMETTWRIRQGTRWHDGTPMTSDDLRFTIRKWFECLPDKSAGTVHFYAGKLDRFGSHGGAFRVAAYQKITNADG